MKRTSSMIYRPTEEARELLLYTTNDGELYRGITTAIIKNLHNKLVKGVYSKEKAVDAFYHLATEGSRKYNKDFGYSFSVQDRFTAAVEMEDYYFEQVQEG